MYALPVHVGLVSAVQACAASHPVKVALHVLLAPQPVGASGSMAYFLPSDSETVQNVL